MNNHLQLILFGNRVLIILAAMQQLFSVPFAVPLFLCAVLRLNVAVAEYHRVQFGGAFSLLVTPVLVVAQYLHLCRVRRRRRRRAGGGRNLTREEEEDIINNFVTAFAVFPSIEMS